MMTSGGLQHSYTRVKIVQLWLVCEQAVSSCIRTACAKLSPMVISDLSERSSVNSTHLRIVPFYKCTIQGLLNKTVKKT